MSGGYETLEVRRDGPVGWLVFDRPKVGNAIDAQMFLDLEAAWAELDADESVRVIVNTGNGDAFQTGLDVRQLAKEPEAMRRSSRQTRNFELRMTAWHCGVWKPVIAAVNGMAVGGGFELAISADLIVAAEHARFALPEIAAAAIADAATIKLPRRIPYHLAMDLLLTGRFMDAQEALRVGLVREVVPGERLLERARELARMLAEGPPLVFAAIKEVIAETAHLPVAEAFRVVDSRALPTIERLYTSEDMLEGARAFAERRAPQWKGR